jgi:HEAT repeat protein
MSDALAHALTDLRDPSPAIRQAAADYLGAHPTREGAQALIAALSEPHFPAQNAIIKALLAQTSPDLVPQLVALGREQSDGVPGQSARRALLEIAQARPEAVLTALKDPDPDVRAWAALTLGDLGRSEACEPLIALIEDAEESHDVRSAAATALGQIDQPQSLQTLLRLAQAAGPERVRVAAITALGSGNDTQAVEPLSRLVAELEGGQVEIGLAAVRTLGVLASTDAVPALMDTLEWLSTQPRGPGYAALDGWRGQVLEALYRIVVEPTVRRASLLRTARLRPLISTIALQRELRAGVAPNNAYAAHVLGWLGRPDALPDLIACLNTTDSALRDAALEALLRFNIVAVPRLIEALERPEPQVREAAADLLGLIGDSSGTEPLFRHLNDEPQAVRIAALRALAGLGGEPAYAALVLALNDPALAEHAIGLIGGLGEETLIDEFKRYLQGVLYQSQADEAIKWAAARALSMLGDELAASILLNAIRSHDPRLRHAAANALSLVRGRRAVNVLIEATGDRDWLVRQKSIDALSHINDSRTLAALEPLARDPEWRVRLALVGAFSRLRDHRAFGPLRELAQDPDPWVRRAVMAACARLDDIRAREILLLGTSDRAGAVRDAAYQGLEINADPTLLPVLRAGIFDDEIQVRLHALRALAVISNGDPNVLELLTPLRHDPDPSVRLALADTLGEIAVSEAAPLLGALARDAEAAVRERAVLALSHCRDQAAFEVLVSLLAFDDMRASVLNELRRDVDRALRALLLAARSRDPVQRAAAARGLRGLGTTHGAAALAQLARDSDVGVQTAATGSA